jgi:hypothetical protein
MGNPTNSFLAMLVSMPEQHAHRLVMGLPRGELVELRRAMGVVLDAPASTPEHRIFQQRLELLCATVDQLLNQKTERTETTKGVTRWHPGKIVMLWGALVVGFLVANAIATNGDEGVGLIVWLMWVGAAVWVFVSTWRWFGGRE